MSSIIKRIGFLLIALGLCLAAERTVQAAGPTVSFAAPADKVSDGDTVSVILNVPVAATAGSFPIAQVVFSVDGTPAATVTSAPYSFIWDTTLISNGSHVLQATVTDTASATDSASITVTVHNLTIPWTTTAGKNVKSLTVLVPQVGGRVDWSKSNNKIVFDKMSPTGYYQIYTMNSDGSGQTCVTCSNGTLIKNNGNPAWSPSGQYIIFQSQDPAKGDGAGATKGLGNPGAGGNNLIYVMNADGSNARELSSVSGVPASPLSTLHPHFSTGGTKVIWAQDLGAGGANGNWAIIEADFNGASSPPISNVQVLQPRGANLFYETHGFSPDDTKMIYTSNPDPSTISGNDIYTSSLQGTNTVDLTNSSTYDEHAHYSPNGQYIAWMSNQTLSTGGSLTQSELWLMNPDGSNQTRLTYFNDPTAPEYIPGNVIVSDNDWSVDNQHIVFSVQGNNGTTLDPQGGSSEAIVLLTLNSATTAPPPPSGPSGFTNLSAVRVYPNPWRADKHEGILITFDQLVSGSTVKIFDLSGHWVKTLSASGESVTWDRTNDSGDAVASGLYLYVITDAQGDRVRGKLTIIK